MSDFTYTGAYPPNYTESRPYNDMLQLTRIWSGVGVDMEYTYPAGTNNGRITQSIDHVANETVNYTYDALNRLGTPAARLPSATAAGFFAGLVA